MSDEREREETTQEDLAAALQQGGFQSPDSLRQKAPATGDVSPAEINDLSGYSAQYSAESNPTEVTETLESVQDPLKGAQVGELAAEDTGQLKPLNSPGMNPTQINWMEKKQPQPAQDTAEPSPEQGAAEVQPVEEANPEYAAWLEQEFGQTPEQQEDIEQVESEAAPTQEEPAPYGPEQAQAEIEAETDWPIPEGMSQEDYSEYERDQEALAQHDAYTTRLPPREPANENSLETPDPEPLEAAQHAGQDIEVDAQAQESRLGQEWEAKTEKAAQDAEMDDILDRYAESTDYDPEQELEQDRDEPER